MNGLERKLNPQNAADTARRQRREADVLKRREIVAGSLDEISRNLGDLYSGRFLALIDGAEPTDADAVGAFMSAEPEVFGDVSANIGTVKLGQPAAGFNVNGDFFAGLGSLIINEEGQTMSGMGFPLRFDMTVELSNRRVKMGWFSAYRGGVSYGGLIPVWAMSYGDPDDYEVTVPNGNFETGDFTGWVATAGSQVVAVSSVDTSRINRSTYCAKKISYPSSDLTTDYITVTGGAQYRIRAKSYGEIAPVIEVKWYTSANALISSDSMAMEAGHWIETVFYTVAPAGAAKMKLNFVGGPTVIDDVMAENVSLLDELRFEDEGLNYNRGLWPEQAQVGWDAAQAWGTLGAGGLRRKTMAYSAQTDQWWGYVSALSQADAKNGDWYILKLPLAAGTYEWRMNYRSATDRGRVDLYVNGTKVSGATPFDMRAGTAATNQAWTVSDISLAKHGVHEFKVMVNGTSGSYYRVGASFITIRRTG